MFDVPALTKSLFYLRRISRQLWMRTTLIAMLALISAGVGTVLEGFVPQGLADRIDAGAVTRILEILASSMLAVTTFSLSVMVTARQWASGQSTPRAQQLVLEDSVTQIVLATFLGAFVFALASLILIETGIYSGNSVVVILTFTLIVIALVVVAILRWIEHLSELGGVAETTSKIEHAALHALKLRASAACLGGAPLKDGDIPKSAKPVAADCTGYVQHVDAGRLNAAAEDCEGKVYLLATPGTFITEGAPLVRATGDISQDHVREAFVIGTERSFEQDPRFGLIVLSEVAQRALSPGVNDPGTAVSVIGRLLRLLLPIKSEDSAAEDPKCSRLFVPPIPPSDFVRDAFDSIGRDAAGTVEVHLVLQEALARLAESEDAGMRKAAREAAGRALAFADSGLLLDDDKARVRDAAPQKGK